MANKGKSRSGRPPKGEWEPDPKQLEIFYEVCQGRTHREIAAERDISHSSVTQTASKVRAWLVPQWAEDIRGIKVQHTESLLHVFREAMAAWERSKREAVEVREKDIEIEGTSLQGTEKTKTTKWQCGDPRFLAEARAALREIRDIWGANAPIKVEHSGELRVAGMSVEEANRQLLEQVEKVKGRLLAPQVN